MQPIFPDISAIELLLAMFIILPDIIPLPIILPDVIPLLIMPPDILPIPELFMGSVPDIFIVEPDMFMADPLMALPAIFPCDMEALLILPMALIPVALTGQLLFLMQPVLAGQEQLPDSFKQVQLPVQLAILEQMHLALQVPLVIQPAMLDAFIQVQFCVQLTLSGQMQLILQLSLVMHVSFPGELVAPRATPIPVSSKIDAISIVFLIILSTNPLYFTLPSSLILS